MLAHRDASAAAAAGVCSAMAKCAQSWHHRITSHHIKPDYISISLREIIFLNSLLSEYILVLAGSDFFLATRTAIDHYAQIADMDKKNWEKFAFSRQ